MISATHFHAMAVHFPIAILMAGFLSELIEATQLHEQAAAFALTPTVITAIFYLCNFIMKFSKSWVRITCIILFAGAVRAIVRTGYLGGQLVYRHGAGVELALPDFSNPGVE